MQNKAIDLGNGSIGRILFKLAVPAILAQLVNLPWRALALPCPSSC
jgi:hypothetical protein